ncbi:MAG: YHS domain-containing protein [Desulfobacteraceae bacterium]|nr:YHS domain-containing protein [Desulfobacteraceae bacterium]
MKKAGIIVFSAIAFGLSGFGALLPFAHAAAQTKCPVMNGAVDKKVYTDYKGQRVYFCCTGCVENFNKDPEKYLGKMKAEGVTPEKTP